MNYVWTPPETKAVAATGSSASTGATGSAAHGAAETLEAGTDAAQRVGEVAARLVPELSPGADAPIGWFERELASLVDVLGPALWLRLLWGLLLTVLIYRMINGTPRIFWRLGLDRKRRAGAIASAVGLLMLLAGFVWTLRPILAAAPGVSLLGLGGVGLLASLALPNVVQSFVAGIRMSFRRRLREGQQISISDMRGTVRRIGLFETTLRTPDGATVHVPNHVFARDKLTVIRAQNAALIEFSIGLDDAIDDETLDRVLGVIFLSPYRRAGTKPRIELPHGEKGVLNIAVQTWATREVESVERALRRAVMAALAEESRAEEDLVGDF